MALHHHHQYRSPFGDTTYTKVFVGGLAWETPTEKMREYFDRFGEILEAVIITDRTTGKSKGYGFVTFRDPQSAIRACEDPNPMIDGRRANCNIAALGRPRPPTPRGRGQGGIGQGAPSPSSSPSLSQYGGMQAPMQAMPPPQTANPFFYQTYGYTPYTPGYGYPQTMYNPQYQQAQYYTQLFGSQASSSLSNPYHPYAYPFQPSRATFYSASTQRVPGASYVYYPTTQTAVEGPSTTPYTASGATSAFSNYALQNPPPTLARQQTTSSPDSQAQQRTTTEAEAAIVVSGGSPST